MYFFVFCIIKNKVKFERWIRSKIVDVFSFLRKKALLIKMMKRFLRNCQTKESLMQNII